jgi:hypothetical protein
MDMMGRMPQRGANLVEAVMILGVLIVVLIVAGSILQQKIKARANQSIDAVMTIGQVSGATPGSSGSSGSSGGSTGTGFPPTSGGPGGGTAPPLMTNTPSGIIKATVSPVVTFTPVVP